MCVSPFPKNVNAETFCLVLMYKHLLLFYADGFYMAAHKSIFDKNDHGLHERIRGCDKSDNPCLKTETADSFETNVQLSIEYILLIHIFIITIMTSLAQSETWR